jgi:ribonuclease BN (tRNA processing enzyme)
VKITLVPSAVVIGDKEPLPFLTSYLVNDTIAVDAGSIGLLQSLDQQTRIRHVLLSHSHIDHLASLPILLENVYDNGTEPVTIHASQPVLECLQKDIFNNRLWPDFIALSREGPAFLKLHSFQPGGTFVLDGLRITPVAVNHAVPTCGFVIDDGTAAVVIAGDTGPTEELWQCARALPHLKAVFLEATFPNDMTSLAEISGHLTPASFAAEVAKIGRPVRVIAVHIKARYYQRIVEELEALRLPRLEIGCYGKSYVLS